MSKRALLPGERETWERACREERWVVRADSHVWFHGWRWLQSPLTADLMSRESAYSIAFSPDVIAYRARSVRADGTPVVP
jgi:hypothetical protein